MNIEKIKDVLHATPFQPFRIRTADGKSIPILHPEVAFPMPKDDLLLVTKEKGGFYLIGGNLITHVETVRDPGDLQELIKESRG